MSTWSPPVNQHSFARLFCSFWFHEVPIFHFSPVIFYWCLSRYFLPTRSSVHFFHNTLSPVLVNAVNDDTYVVHTTRDSRLNQLYLQFPLELIPVQSPHHLYSRTNNKPLFFWFTHTYGESFLKRDFLSCLIDHSPSTTANVGRSWTYTGSWASK